MSEAPAPGEATGRSLCALGLEVRLPAPGTAARETVERRLARIRPVLVAGGVAVAVLAIVPEVLNLTPDFNDSAFHLGVMRNTIAAVKEGANPLDFWVPTWLAGFPLFHYYQPGPYLLLAALHFLLGWLLSPLLLYRLVSLLALAAFPLANYRAMRWLGLPAEAAAWGGFLACFISADGAYGIELESFTYSGWGLFAQLIALPFLPLALAAGWRAIDQGRRTLGAAALLAAALLSHILYGYIVGVSLALAPFAGFVLGEFRPRLARLARLYLQGFALVAFFVVPLALDLRWHAKSLYDEAGKFDSHGATVVLSKLISGKMFDDSRMPALTVLVVAGLYLTARAGLERKSAVHAWVAGGFVLWLLLYFGRPTWGRLIDLLPMSKGLHLERLSSGVHVFALWLAAIALGRLTRWCLGLEPSVLRLAAASVLGAVVLLPLVGERATYLLRNGRSVAAGKQRFDAELTAFEPIRKRLASEPAGRVYAGHSGNWGAEYNVGKVHVYHLLSAGAVDGITNAPFSWSLSTDFEFQYNPRNLADSALYDIRYVLTDQPDLVPPGELLVRSGKHRLFRLPGEGPFQIVSVPLAVAGDKESTWYMTMAWAKGTWARRSAHARLLFSGERIAGLPTAVMVDPFRYELPAAAPAQSVFDPPGLFVSEPPAPARGRLSDARLAREEGQVTAELAEPGVLLFKSTYHPCWQATVDGARVETQLLTPGLIGIPVPAGTHQVRVAYRPGWWKELLLVAGILVAFVLDRFPAPAPPAAARGALGD